MKRLLLILSIVAVFLCGCSNYSDAEIEEIKQKAIEENALAYVQENYTVGDVFGRNDITEYVASNYHIDTVYSDRVIKDFIKKNYHYVSVEDSEGRTVVANTDDIEEVTYIINKKTKVFHHPYCNSIGAMKESNKIVTHESYQSLVDKKYKPCGNEVW